MAVTLGQLVKNDICAVLKTRQAGSKIRYYDNTGSSPILLVELILLYTGGWSTPVNGVTICIGWLPTAAVATGTATTFQYSDSAGNSLITGLIGLPPVPNQTAPLPDLIVSDTNIIQNQTVSLTSISFTVP